MDSSPPLRIAIDFLAGIGLGTTVAHFVIDADAWRLRRSSVRHDVTERFGFLFPLVSARAHAEGSRAPAR